MNAEESLELHRKIDSDRVKIAERNGYCPLVLIEFSFNGERGDAGLSYRIVNFSAGFRTFFAVPYGIDEYVDATKEEQQSVAESLRINRNYLSRHDFEGREGCELCSAFYNERYRLIGSNQNAFAMSINRHLGAPFDRCHSLVLPIPHVESLAEITETQSLDTHVMLEQLARKIFEGGSPFVIAGMNSPENATQRHIHYQVVGSPYSLDRLVELNEMR